MRDSRTDNVCPRCHAPVPEQARFCGSCRYELAESQSSNGSQPAAHDITHDRTAESNSILNSSRPIRPAAPARLDGLGNSAGSVVATVLFVWLFNVPLAILYGLVGMVVGAFTGAFGGAWFLTGLPVIGDYMDVFAVQVGGIIGALAGAAIGLLVGAFAGFLAPILLLGGGDPITILIAVLGQIMVGVIVGALYTVYAVNGERSRLKVMGIRRPSRREAALLQPIIDACAASLHMSTTPTLMIDDDRTPNAFAWTRHIVVHVGLLEAFEYDPKTVSGVICHELGHWNSGDPIAGTFLQGVALPLYLSYSALTAIPRVVNHPFVRVLIWLFTWPIMLATKYVIIPLQTADGRRNEYRADEAAMLAGESPGLRRVLAFVKKSFDGTRNGWVQAVCASHPPNELRLEALELPGVVYELPDKDSAGAAADHATASGSTVVRD